MVKFRTRNLGLATYLYMQGIHILKINRVNGKISKGVYRYQWIFTFILDDKEIVNKYMNSQVSVQPKIFLKERDKLKKLAKRIYNSVDN